MSKETSLPEDFVNQFADDNIIRGERDGVLLHDQAIALRADVGGRTRVGRHLDEGVLHAMLQRNVVALHARLQRVDETPGLHHSGVAQFGRNAHGKRLREDAGTVVENHVLRTRSEIYKALLGLGGQGTEKKGQENDEKMFHDKTGY